MGKDAVSHRRFPVPGPATTPADCLHDLLLRTARHAGSPRPRSVPRGDDAVGPRCRRRRRPRSGPGMRSPGRIGGRRGCRGGRRFSRPVCADRPGRRPRPGRPPPRPAGQRRWQVVHGILAFGDELPLATADGKTTALAWLLDGGALHGWRLRPGSQGVVATIEEGSTTGQGHPDQWIGYLAQSGLDGVSIDTPISVNGKPHTLRDLLTQAQADIRPGAEATWTLMALSAWLPAGSWTSSDGRTWTIEDVVAMEAAADIEGAACGGCHRLYGLVQALAAHQASAAGPAGSERGGWADAEATIEACIEIARRHQQPDGSFSIHFFEPPRHLRRRLRPLGRHRAHLRVSRRGPRRRPPCRAVGDAGSHEARHAPRTNRRRRRRMRRAVPRRSRPAALPRASLQSARRARDRLTAVP